MILFCCASELGPPEDLSAIEVILYYYYYYYIICQQRQNPVTISMLKTLKGIVTLNMSTMTESSNNFHAKDPERYRNFEYVNNDRIQ